MTNIPPLDLYAYGQEWIKKHPHVFDKPVPSKPLPPKTMKTRTKIILGILGFIALNMFVRSIGHVSADTLARKAYEARMQARRAHCQIIAEKTTQCYAGNQELCTKLRESITWFTNEYGETPELACSSTDLPFGAGTAK